MSSVSLNPSTSRPYFRWFPHVIAVVLLLWTGLNSPALAQVTSDVVPVPLTVQVEPDDTFQITLQIHVPPEGAVAVADIVMSYNPEVVNVTSLALAPGTPLSIVIETNIDNTTGRIEAATFGFAAATTTFDHLIVTLVAVNEGSTLLQHVTEGFPVTQLAFSGEDVTGDLPPALINVGAGEELDCLGVPNGDADTDECGICYAGGNTHADWNTSCADCFGVPNGTAEEDLCGVCYPDGADNPEWNSTCLDCLDVPNGDADTDECGICYTGGNTNPDWNTTCADCFGVPNGTAEEDLCGVCYPDGADDPEWNTTCLDCLDVPNGDADTDECGICYAGGNTNPDWNSTCADCFGVPNGTAEEDLCGVCYPDGADNPEWNTTCLDCLDVPNGDADTDECGICYAGGDTNIDWNTSCADCLGIPNGDAEIDECDECYAGGITNPLWNSTCLPTSVAELISEEGGASLAVWPNPAADNVFVRFELVNSGTVSVDLLDISGKLVADVYRGSVAAGAPYLFDVDVSELATGMYFSRMITDDGVLVERLVVRQ